MLKQIHKSEMKRLLPKRKPDSHKGENGKILIIGGSKDYYGAPVLAGFGALYSGADLVYLYVPECNFDCTRSLSPDLIVKKYEGDYFNESSANKIIELAKSCDCILIGPGIGKEKSIIDGVLEILKNVKIPTVLDAEAMFAIKKVRNFPLEQTLVITPHQNEFENLVDKDTQVKAEDTKSVILLRSIAMDLHINIILKGHTDFVSSEEGILEINKTGNEGMTVGGSGDVLAGVVASFLSQGVEAFDACRCATFYIGKSGDILKKQKGICFSASDLAKNMPFALK